MVLFHHLKGNLNFSTLKEQKNALLPELPDVDIIWRFLNTGR